MIIDFLFPSNFFSYQANQQHSTSLPAVSVLGALIGAISSCIAMLLCTMGYLAIPGLGPMVAMGSMFTICIGTLLGAMLGLGLAVSFYVFLKFALWLYRLALLANSYL